MATLARVLATAGLLAAGGASAESPDPNAVPDPLFDDQWALHNAGQVYPAGCTTCGQGIAGADSHWLRAWTGGFDGAGVVIAIGTPGLLPTVSCENSQIAGQLWVNPNEVLNGVDDDSNGFVDDIHGANFFLNDGNVCNAASTSNHDTDVARLAVAPVDGLSSVGAAPGAQLMILSGFDSTSFYTRALAYADDMGARLIVVPYTATALGGGATPAQQCSNAGLAGGIDRPGALANSNALVAWGFPDEFPGCDPAALAVAQSDSSDAAVGGPSPFLDFAAPAERGWALGVAQSWALPVAVGVGALALSAEPGLSRAELLQRLRNGSDKVGAFAYDATGWNDRYGYGRLNAWATLKLGDLDGDGVFGDGDGSGVAGDAPCTGGQTLGCDDNCPYFANAGQEDIGGLGISGSGPPDGIGDACQCGDVTDNGTVNLADAGAIRFKLAAGTDLGPKCSVGGGCTLADEGRINVALASASAEVLKQRCERATWTP